MEHRFVPNYAPKYLIREDGAVFNSKGVRLSPWFNDKGYPCIHLYKEGKRTHFKVHRLVALAYVPNPHPRKFKVVLHLDDDPANPHKNNLKWGTQSMNMKDMVNKGRGKGQFTSKNFM